MSLDQYILNALLLIYILGTNLGSRQVTRRRLVLPLLLVGVAALAFLQRIPSAGNDAVLEAIGAASGLLLGVGAGLLMRVERQGAQVVAHAGLAYAVLWTGVIGGRMLFAFGATHWFGAQIGAFSAENRISGADAWTTAFILMALAMVAARVATTALLASAALRPGLAKAAA
jgi:hypothetical protein